MDIAIGSRVALTGLTNERGRRLNGLTATVDAGSSERWVVRVLADPQRGLRVPISISVRPENLLLLREHRTTVEVATTAEARELLSGTFANAAATGGTCAFGDQLSLPADVVLLHIFPLLSRSTTRAVAAGCLISAGELDRVGEVCHEWRGICLALRALTPACARDVAVKLRIEGGADEPSGADGEYRLWAHGDRSQPPLELFCHNVLSARPTEFVSLRNPSTNLSYFPPGGAARGTVLVSSFSKLRICPWSLTVKTDDFTFATSAGEVLQSYWNGRRTLQLSELPFATARDAAGHGGATSPNRGQAQIDLRGTGLGVRVDGFTPLGCAAFGVVAVPVEGCADARSLVQPRVALYGGGFAGRMTPTGDRTTDERAAGGNFDDEGRNGGWVLPLARESADAPRWPGGTREAQLPVATADLGGHASGAGMLLVDMRVYGDGRQVIPLSDTEEDESEEDE